MNTDMIYMNSGCKLDWVVWINKWCPDQTNIVGL